MITPEGDYLSNLSAPDLRKYFRHLHWRRMGHSMGHLVASDWADKAEDDPVFGLYKKCGLWTCDEAAILYNVAKSCGGVWIDIGAHTGWTTAHLGRRGYAIDPMHSNAEFRERFCLNVGIEVKQYLGADMTSLEYFREKSEAGIFMSGCVVDGDHSEGKPQEDAENAARHLAETGVIIFHDGIGRPVREAVTWLMDHGFKARCYYTPHLIFCCWRGDFTPPAHDSDPRINWTAHKVEMSKDFDFSRLS